MATEHRRGVEGEDTAAGTEPVVALDNVEIVYDNHFLAVQGISLEANRGDIVALLGPNGAGKSTVLKMISGIGRSERGEVTRGGVYYDGLDVTNSRPKPMVDRGVTHVLEGRRVFEDLTVEENLRCGLYRSGRRFGFDEADYQLAFEYFPQLEEILDLNAGYASGGQQQMLVIARALLSLMGEERDVDVPRSLSVAVEHDGGSTSASDELAPGGSTRLAVGDVAVDVAFDGDETLSGSIVNEGGDPLAGLTVELELERPSTQACRRRRSIGRLDAGDAAGFQYDAAPPKIILLDEPSLGLAPKLVNDIFDKLVEINRRENVTMLVADQNAKKTLEVADYGYVMENGQVELHDPAGVLMDREEIKEYYLGTSQGGDRYRNIRHYKIKKRYE